MTNKVGRNTKTIKNKTKQNPAGTDKLSKGVTYKTNITKTRVFWNTNNTHIKKEIKNAILHNSYQIIRPQKYFSNEFDQRN